MFSSQEKQNKKVGYNFQYRISLSKSCSYKKLNPRKWKRRSKSEVLAALESQISISKKFGDRYLNLLPYYVP